MMSPVVSICLPNLNNRPYLEERLATIFAQTFSDWELIVYDNYSDDGAWELFQATARKHPRMRIAQAPREGMYANWNNCIRAARGEYVYIATSDDTMTPDCLEQMVGALERNPDCGVCHCCLEVIDESGKPVRSREAWENWEPQKYFGEWVHIPHIRRAPHDGVLYFGLYTVYTSITQLLIRRRVFERLGLFLTNCGSHADFEWGMRVGLNENVVHVPKKLATWRQHSLQATQLNTITRIRAQGEFHRLVGEALKSLSNRNPKLAKALRRSSLNHFYLASELGARRLLSSSRFARLRTMTDFVIKHPMFSLYWLYYKIVRRERVTGEFREAVRQEFSRLGLTNLLLKVESC
jgi:glycosyltransferase involved in cell wall biosynthesis